MEKRGIIETHNPYRDGGSPRNPFKRDGEISNREIFYKHKPLLASLNRPLILTKSQKKFKKKLRRVINHRKDSTLSLLLNAKDKKTKKPIFSKSERSTLKKIGKGLDEKDTSEEIFDQ